MSYEIAKGRAGLKYGLDHSIETKAATAEILSGAPVWTREGVQKKAFNSPASTVAGVAAVFTTTVSTNTSAEGHGTLSINGVVYTGATLASASTPTQVAASLVTAASADPDFTVANVAGAITATAKVTGTADNSAVITITVPTGASASAVTRTTTGVDAVGASAFRGVVLFEHTQDTFIEGDALSVVTRGKLFVTVAEDVKANAAAYITAENKFGAAGTAIKGRYITNALAGDIAVLEIFDN